DVEERGQSFRTAGLPLGHDPSKVLDVRPCIRSDISLNNSMAASDSNVLKLAPDATSSAYRSAPHNIEAEQSLLGAILVNNDAFYRVPAFLLPEHFFDPTHRQLFETAGSLIRMPKLATPVAQKTSLPAGPH